MSGVIEGFRWALTGHGYPSTSQFLVSALMVLALPLGGLIFFQRMEGTVADRV
jgi:lipopolysaccharide transport system permease protein